jgi:hypothetical protein
MDTGRANHEVEEDLAVAAQPAGWGRIVHDRSPSERKGSTGRHKNERRRGRKSGFARSPATASDPYHRLGVGRNREIRETRWP